MDAGLYWRPRSETETTEFSLTRFLVPYLSGFRGLSLFMDCDMLVQDDVTKLLLQLDGIDRLQASRYCPRETVWVCKHNYTPSTDRKMDDMPQTAYPRKNWSSFMVFNNERCRVLTPEYVNDAPGLDLHRFAWLTDDQIGELALDWNWLVGEYSSNRTAKNLHYTLGGPWFKEHRDCQDADLWLDEYHRMLQPEPLRKLGC